MCVTYLVNKVGLNKVLLLIVVGTLNGDEEDVDAGLACESRRLFHLVCGPTVH